jgi:nucleolar GTP-binding protein
LLKIVRSTAVVRRQLRLKTKPFVKDAMTDFERLLADRAFGTGQLARALRRLQVADSRIGDLSQESQRELPRTADSDAIATLVRRVYGRLASHVREVEPDLELLEKVRLHLKDRPHLDPRVPTVVIAGFPNVGKSSLVGRLSTARPKVAAYPFTTLAIQVGHADLGFDRLQVLDTPGVLGRSAHRNPAESEAETAVANAANVVLFILDPTESCGYTMAEQESLLARWQKEFPKAEILEVETKADLIGTPTPRRRVSSTTGAGLEELRADLEAALARNPLPPIPAPEEEIFRAEEYAPGAKSQAIDEAPTPRRGRKRGK